MQVRIDRTRMAMDGNWYSYEVVVPASEVNRERISYFIVRDGAEYVTLADALRPAAIGAMPRGRERFDAFMAHARRCDLRAAELIAAHFPELRRVDLSQLGQLVRLPNFDGSHDTRTAEIEATHAA